MTLRFSSVIGLVACCLAGCTQVTTESLPQQNVDDTFRRNIVRWTSGEIVVFAYKAFEKNGRVAICGAWSESPGDSNQNQFNDRMLATRRAEIDGETLVNDVSWFAKGAFNGEEKPNGLANCRLTDDPWRAGYDKKIRLRASRTRFVVYD